MQPIVVDEFLIFGCTQKTFPVIFSKVSTSTIFSFLSSSWNLIDEKSRTQSEWILDSSIFRWNHWNRPHQPSPVTSTGDFPLEKSGKVRENSSELSNCNGIQLHIITSVWWPLDFSLRSWFTLSTSIPVAILCQLMTWDETHWISSDVWQQTLRKKRCVTRQEK